MKKKPARQPRKIEVIEDAPVAAKTTATKGTAETKTKADPKAKSTKTKTAPTDATAAVVDQPAAQPQQNVTVAKLGPRKGRRRRRQRPANPPLPRNQTESLNSRPLSRGWKAS